MIGNRVRLCNNRMMAVERACSGLPLRPPLLICPDQRCMIERRVRRDHARQTEFLTSAHDFPKRFLGKIGRNF